MCVRVCVCKPAAAGLTHWSTRHLVHTNPRDTAQASHIIPRPTQPRKHKKKPLHLVVSSGSCAWAPETVILACVASAVPHSHMSKDPFTPANCLLWKSVFPVM